MKKRILTQLGRYAAWVSQTLNCLILFGHHDQTISSRCWTNRHRFGWSIARRMVDKLFYHLPVFGHSDHCYKSYISDVKYAREILSLKRKHK